MNPSDVVALTYKRTDPKLYTYDGRISVGEEQEEFANKSFNEMLELASGWLRRLPQHRLLFRREEAPYPMTLPAGIEDLLRSDLDGAIRALSVAPQRIEVRSKVPKRTDMLLGELRAGIDTLADALGDEVYLRMRARQRDILIEDPVTGRWVELVHLPGVMPKCGTLTLTSQVYSKQNQWATIRTSDILALNLERYYLPRRWNPNQGWISHQSLLDMYEFYKQEKDNVSE